MATKSTSGKIFGEATGGVFLDPELFARLKISRDPKECAGAWLDTVSRIIEKMDMGVVVLGPSGRGPFSSIALWPQGTRGSRELSDVTESAVRVGKLVVESGNQAREDGTTGVAIGYPLIINGQICGAAAIEIEEQPNSDIRLAIDQLEWSCGWLEYLILRQRGTSSDRLVTVVISRSNLRNGTGSGEHDGYRDHLAVIAEYLGHSDLCSNQSNHRHTSPTGA